MASCTQFRNRFTVLKTLQKCLLVSSCKQLKRDLNNTKQCQRSSETEPKNYGAKFESSQHFNDLGESETHFGFEKVTEKEKAEKVYSVFSNVSNVYDIMNDVMSIGIHRIWKDQLIATLHLTPGTKLLDVAGGTGDVAFRFLKAIRHSESKWPEDSLTISNPLEVAEKTSEPPTDSGAHVVVCDINSDMLKVGKKKAEEMGFSNEISWMQGDAQALPFPSNTFDAYTIAFGIRNVVRIDKALREAFRVLKPGGRFLCLEFSSVQNPLISRLYDTYSFQVIPVLGQVFARDWKSYQYLVESIRQFPSQEDFATALRDAQFQCVQYQNLHWGIAAIHSGYKLT